MNLVLVLVAVVAVFDPARAFWLAATSLLFAAAFRAIRSAKQIDACAGTRDATLRGSI